MLKEKLKQLTSKMEGEDNKKKIESLVFFLIILIVVLVAINLIWNDDKEKEKRALAGEIHFLVDSKYTDIMRKAGIDKELKRESFKGFIRTWEKRAGLIEELDVVLWSRLVQEVIVKAKDDIRLSSRMDLK